jgi:hypothetical protein
LSITVKQRGKMARESGKTASKTVHPDMNGLIKQDTSKDRFIMSSEVIMIMSNQNKQIKPDFTIEFKQSAARLVNEKGGSM